MRKPPPPQNAPVAVVAAAPAVPMRLTRSKMARKPPGATQTMTVPVSAAAAKDDATPTPSTDGYTVSAAPPTVAPVAVVAAAPAVPMRLTRSKMARKPPGATQTVTVPVSAAATKDDATPTPSADGYTEGATPLTVVAKGLVSFISYIKSL